MTNIYHSASPRAIYATRLSPQAVYFIQTGGSALSNTYNIHYLYYKLLHGVNINMGITVAMSIIHLAVTNIIKYLVDITYPVVMHTC